MSFEGWTSQPSPHHPVKLANPVNLSPQRTCLGCSSTEEMQNNATFFTAPQPSPRPRKKAAPRTTWHQGFPEQTPETEPDEAATGEKPSQRLAMVFVFGTIALSFSLSLSLTLAPRSPAFFLALCVSFIPFSVRLALALRLLHASQRLGH